MNSQPCRLRPLVEYVSPANETLYQGNQNETSITAVAGPKMSSLRLSTLTRRRILPTRLGFGLGMTVGRMAAPQFGQSAVPGNTSTRQREHAGNGHTSLRAVGDAPGLRLAAALTAAGYRWRR